MSRGTTAKVRRSAGRAVAGVARHAVWLVRPRGRVSRAPHLPDDLWLERVEEALNGIDGAIQQISMRKARRLTAIAIAKLTGVTTIGGISSLITALGTASTGAAISSLSGAAAVSAKLYFIGSLFGLGAVAGGTILAAVGIGVGGLIAFFAKRGIFGRKRREADLEEHEIRILAACLTLLKSIKEQRDSGSQITAREAAEFAKHALFPVVAEIEAHWDRVSMAKAGVKPARPFETTLKPTYRRALRRYAGKLEKLAAETLK